MKNAEIEAKVLNIIDRIKHRHPIEDSLIELKSTWIEPHKAARLIAGHANAARGTQILWIVGLNEKTGVVGASHNEFSIWFSQVVSQFDGLAPSVIDLNTPIDGKIVVALLFDTDRAPYVIKNHAKGGPALEVPWREGTSIRTASRSDLIKLLSPLQLVPDFEILQGSFVLRGHKEDLGNVIYRAKLLLTIYVTPLRNDLIVIPFHRSSVRVAVPKKLKWLEFAKLNLKHPTTIAPGEYSVGSSYSLPRESASETINSTPSELLIYGPGMFFLEASAELARKLNPMEAPALVRLTFLPAKTEREISIVTEMKRVDARNDE